MSKLIAPARLLNLRAAYRRAREGSEYWRHTLPDVPEGEIGLGTLASVPIHTSADIARLDRALRIRTGVPDSVRFTGGTTGKRLAIYRAVEHRADPQPEGGALRALGLTPSAGTGGPEGMVAGEHGLLQAPMKHRAGYDYAVQLLLREHDFEGYTARVRYMALPLPMLKRLMSVMIEHGCGPGDFDLAALMTWGYHLSPAWRARIQAAFPAAAIDTTYGFTETKARAPGCRECGAYHYGVDAVWEVLDPVRGTPNPEGLGRLVVTPLCDRDTVLFRYAPGDMVVRTPACPLVGEPGFRFAGREAQMVPVERDGRRAYPVFPVHVQEAVDTAHWIGWYNAPRHRGMTATEGRRAPQVADRARPGGSDRGSAGADLRPEAVPRRLGHPPCPGPRRPGRRQPTPRADRWARCRRRHRRTAPGRAATPRDLPMLTLPCPPCRGAHP